MRKVLIITAVVCLIASACVWFVLRARRALKVPLTTVQAFSVEQHLLAEFGKPIRFEAGNIEWEANQYGTHESAEGHWIFQKGQPVFKFDLKYEDGRWLIFSFQQR